MEKANTKQMHRRWRLLSGLRDRRQIGKKESENLHGSKEVVEYM